METPDMEIPETETPARHCTVLLVDDERHVTSGLRRSLRREPFDVLEAHCAVDALDVLATEDVDIVVSDERMPQMSGAEFLAEVRQRYPDTIRIMLSGQADMDAVVRAINEGEIWRFLFKPCKAEELIATIHQAWRHKELLDRSRWLLDRYRKQNERIERLEREAGVQVSAPPEVEFDADGAIMLETQSLSLDEVLAEINAEIERSRS